MNLEEEGKGICQEGRLEDVCWCMGTIPFYLYWS